MAGLTEIAIGVVGHHRRAGRARRLANKVSAEMITVDPGNLGPVRNHLVAWEWLADATDDWSLVLEDDAEPIEDFVKQARLALDACPSAVASLYLGRARPPHWQDCIARVIMRPECWLMGAELLHGVAVAVRTHLVPVMLAEVCKTVENRDWPVDEAISDWCQRNEIKVAYSHPSLVNHADIPSVIDNHQSRHATDSLTRADHREPRRAWVFGTRNWDPTHVDIPEPVLG
jgi:hypothetical protein